MVLFPTYSPETLALDGALGKWGPAMSSLRWNRRSGPVPVALTDSRVRRSGHAAHEEQRAERLDKIRHLRDGVVAQAAGQIFYAPKTWGAHEYPGNGLGDRIGARGTYRGAEVSLWRVSAEEIATSTSKFPTSTVASPETLCLTSPAVRALYRKDGIDPSLMQCIPIPGHHGTIRVGPRPSAVELSVEMPDGDYLRVWRSTATTRSLRTRQIGRPTSWTTLRPTT